MILPFFPATVAVTESLFLIAACSICKISPVPVYCVFAAFLNLKRTIPKLIKFCQPMRAYDLFGQIF
jgi:hypothetical protein